MAQAAMPDSPEALENLWAQIVEAVGRASPFTKTYLTQAHPISFVKRLLTVGFDPEFSDQLSLVDNSRTNALLQTKLAELGHPGSQIKFIIAAEPAGRVRPKPELEAAVESKAPPAHAEAAPVSPGPSPAKSEAPRPSGPPSVTRENFKNDPLIQKALEVFKGKIVDVKN